MSLGATVTSSLFPCSGVRYWRPVGEDNIVGDGEEHQTAPAGRNTDGHTSPVHIMPAVVSEALSHSYSVLTINSSGHQCSGRILTSPTAPRRRVKLFHILSLLSWPDRTKTEVQQTETKTTYNQDFVVGGAILS